MVGNLIYNKAKIVGDSGEETSIQYPLNVSGRSVHADDLDLANCTNGDFTGAVTDYFNSLTTVNSDVSTTNPKAIKLWFHRTVYTSSVGFGCHNLSKSFSNIKLSFLGSGEEVRAVVDNSTDNTLRNSYLIEFEPVAFNGILIEFYTTNTIGLSNITIPKEAQVAARLKASKDDNTVIDIRATDSGNLRVTNAEDGLAIAKGDVLDTTFIHKFGYAPDFDTSDGVVTIWDGADDAHVDQMTYVYSTAVDIDSISSSSASDVFDFKVQGLTTDYELLTVTGTLQGQTKVALSDSFIRVFRLKNDNTDDNVGHVYCYVDTAITAGVPNDSTQVRAIIQPSNNQTLMTVYTIPAGYTGYMRDWYVSTAGASKTSSYIMELRAREFDSNTGLHKAFQLKHIASINDEGTSHIQHKYEEPQNFNEKTDIELRVRMTAVGGTQAAIAGGFDIVLIKNE